MAAAAARGKHGVDLVAVEQRADAIAVAREDPGEDGDELGRDRALLLRREPKSTDGDRSSRNHAVTSRSSLYSRT